MEQPKQVQQSAAKNTRSQTKTPQQVSGKEPHSPLGKIFALVFLCFIASFLGAWVFVGTGLVPLETGRLTEENRQQLVLEEGEVVADVAERASQSVVSIITVAESTPAGYFGRSVLSEGAGPGVVVSKDGYIITNKHVVGEGTRQVDVILHDGTRHENVKVVGRDPLNDIAFLKINGVNDLPAAELADSNEVKIGQKVIAIGNALGQYQNSVTSGIISGIGRPIVAQSDTNAMEAERFEDLFQTDAAINPGNSGGPLVDLEGRVIGINMAYTEEAQSIGFSIPVNVVKGLMKGVIEEGKVARAYMGVQYVTLTPDAAQQLDIEVDKGAYVGGQDGESGGPVSGGPADKAGIRRGDVIIKINDAVVGERNGLAALLAQYAPGETIKVTFLRDGKEQTTDVTLEEYRN